MDSLDLLRVTHRLRRLEELANSLSGKEAIVFFCRSL